MRCCRDLKILLCHIYRFKIQFKITLNRIIWDCISCNYEITQLTKSCIMKSHIRPCIIDRLRSLDALLSPTPLYTINNQSQVCILLSINLTQIGEHFQQASNCLPVKRVRNTLLPGSWVPHRKKVMDNGIICWKCKLYFIKMHSNNVCEITILEKKLHLISISYWKILQ